MAKSWTISAIKEHFEDLRKADQEAVKVLANNFEARMSNTNEWRGTVESMIKNLATVQQFDQLKEQFDKLEARVNTNASKLAGIMQMGAIVGGIITVIGVVFAIVRGFS